MFHKCPVTYFSKAQTPGKRLLPCQWVWSFPGQWDPPLVDMKVGRWNHSERSRQFQGSAVSQTNLQKSLQSECKCVEEEAWDLRELLLGDQVTAHRCCFPFSISSCYGNTGSWNCRWCCEDDYVACLRKMKERALRWISRCIVGNKDLQKLPFHIIVFSF